MEDDDTDFTPSPSQNTSSNLASLFGFTKKPLQGNSSFTYIAPKAPKRESSPAKKQSEEKTKGKIIFSKAVQAYKLENRCYVNQGVIGIVISGNHDSRVYEIILYKRTKEHLSQIRISPSFTITLSPNNYVSFYDNNKQNWSIMFQSPTDVEQYSQKVAICKFFSQPAKDILIQDLAPASRPKASSKSVVEVIYNSYTLVPEELSKLKEGVKEEINLSEYGFIEFSKALIGCSQNCKRVVIIPHSLGGPWLNELHPNKDLLIEVKIEKIIPEVEPLIPESSADSSAEEPNLKAKGATLKEALASTKSHKANLISRMARMGQATLPVKPELSVGASDSDEENLLASYSKPRQSRNKNIGSSASYTISVPQNSYPQDLETQHQLTLYQNDLALHQVQKLSTPYQQLIPVSTSPVSSPSTDSNISVFLSESRIQAAELRMGISKVSEKVDLVWNKIQSLSEIGMENKAYRPVVMDSGGILTSIQNLIAENEGLKEKIESQKGKIEQQSDRIYHLLELNSKYIEQNSTSQEKQSANDSKLKLEMECLQRKEIEMETANKAASERLKNLEDELTKTNEENKELKKKVEELTSSSEALREKLKGSCDEKAKEVEILKEKITKSSETMVKLKGRLREVVNENENLKSVIQTQKAEIETGSVVMEDSKIKNEAYEKTLESLKKQMSEEETKTESKIESLSQIISNLEEEKKYLLEKIEEKDNQAQLQVILQKILTALKGRFLDSDQQHFVRHVLTTVEEIFKDVISGKLPDEEKLDTGNSDTFVLPTPRTSFQSLGCFSKEIEESESLQETKEYSSELDEKENGEKVEAESTKKKDEADSRCKSYDQGWRTARPPPPPLFDDDDEEDDWLV